VEVFAYQNSGSTLNVLFSNQDSRFQIQWVASSHGAPMNVPTPKTWAAGLWPVGEMNRHMRDTARFFMQPPLAIVRKERNSQTIPRTGWEIVSWDTVVHDTAGAVADDRLYCRRSGYHLFTLQMQWLQDPLISESRFHFIEIYNSSATLIERLQLFCNKSQNTSESYCSSAMVAMTEGDYAQVIARKWVAADQLAGYNTELGHYGCQFEMRWLST
jgi:hypothetical protein